MYKLQTLPVKQNIDDLREQTKSNLGSSFMWKEFTLNFVQKRKREEI